MSWTGSGSRIQASPLTFSLPLLHRLTKCPGLCGIAEQSQENQCNLFTLLLHIYHGSYLGDPKVRELVWYLKYFKSLTKSFLLMFYALTSCLSLFLLLPHFLLPPSTLLFNLTLNLVESHMFLTEPSLARRASLFLIPLSLLTLL